MLSAGLPDDLASRLRFRGCSGIIAMMRYRWEGPVLLTGDKWPGVRPKAGVYRIRIFDPAGRPMAIPRALGTDPDGVLDIGESGDLYGRLYAFWGRAQGKAYSHSAAAEYESWELTRHWPLDRLHFDFFHVDDKKAAEQAELKMLDAYRARFYDRPPLNKSQGKRWKYGSG